MVKMMKWMKLCVCYERSEGEINGWIRIFS